MNSNVNPVVAALVIFLTIVASTLWMWAHGKAAELGGPAAMRISPSGHLFVQMQNQLLEHDSEGNFLKRHDLAAIDVDVFLGGFDFFSDGTILLRRGPDPRTFADNLRAFQRLDNNRGLMAATPASGMARCDTETWQCETFGDSPIDFAAATGIEIDRNTDTVYLSDTTRHVLRKYSASGVELAPPAGGFRFPNALELHDGMLYLADTNHHVVKQVAMDNERFGQAVNSFDVIPNLARVAGRRWPSYLARIGDAWWVNVLKSGMDHGEIYIFDNDWHYQHRVRLPDNADPIALLAFGEHVLVSDWNNDRVWRISPDGEPLQHFASSGLDELVRESAAEKKQYRTYAYAGIANIALLIIALIAKGTDWKRHEPTDLSTMLQTYEGHTGPLTFEPQPLYLKKIRIGMRIAAVLLISTCVLMGLVLLVVGNLRLGIQLAVPVLVIAGIVGLIFRYQRAVMHGAIRFDSDRLVLRDHMGREASSSYQHVAYSTAAIVAGEVAVFLGQPQMPIYDRDAVLALLAERVPKSGRISEFSMQRRLIAIRHPQGMLLIYALVSALLLGAALIVLERL